MSFSSVTLYRKILKSRFAESGSCYDGREGVTSSKSLRTGNSPEITSLYTGSNGHTRNSSRLAARLSSRYCKQTCTVPMEMTLEMNHRSASWLLFTRDVTAASLSFTPNRFISLDRQGHKHLGTDVYHESGLSLHRRRAGVRSPCLRLLVWL